MTKIKRPDPNDPDVKFGKRLKNIEVLLEALLERVQPKVEEEAVDLPKEELRIKLDSINKQIEENKIASSSKKDK